MVDVNIDVVGKDFVNNFSGLDVVCLELMERIKMVNICVSYVCFVWRNIVYLWRSLIFDDLRWNMFYICII